MSMTLSLVRVVSGGGGGGAGVGSTTGAGGGVRAANSAAAFSAARFFDIHKAPPPAASRITSAAAIPMNALVFEGISVAGAAAVAPDEAGGIGPRDCGPMEGGGSGAVSRVV